MKTTGKIEVSAFVNYGLLTQFCAAVMGKSDNSLRLAFSRADQKLTNDLKTMYDRLQR